MRRQLFPLALVLAAAVSSFGCTSLSGDYVDVYSAPARVTNVKGLPVVVERPWLVREVVYEVTYIVFLGFEPKESGQVRTQFEDGTVTTEPKLVWQWKLMGTFRGEKTEREVINRKEIFTFSTSRPASGTVTFNATMDTASQYPSSLTYAAEDTTIKSIGDAVAQIVAQLKDVLRAPGAPTAAAAPKETPAFPAPIQVVEVSKKVLSIRYVALDEMARREPKAPVFDVSKWPGR